MKYIQTEKEFFEAMFTSRVICPPNPHASRNYPDNIVYSCGCGETHILNSNELEVLGTAYPNNFLLGCQNEYATFIQIKGFFKPKPIPVWSSSPTFGS